MAFTSLGTIGSANSTTAGTSLVITTSVTLNVGELAILTTASDNISTVNANTNEVTTVVDSAGNVWTKLREFCNARTAAGAGSTVSVWASDIAFALSAGGTITLTFSGSITSKVAKVNAFSKSANTTYVDSGSIDVANTALDPSSLDLTIPIFVDCLLIRANALETNVTTETATSGYTPFGAVTASTGVALTSQATSGSEFKILDNTNSNPTQTSDPTASAVDGAGIFIVLRQQAVDGVGILAFKALTIVSTGLSYPLAGQGAVTLPFFTIEASGHVPILPALTLSAVGKTGTVSSVTQQTLSLNSLTVSAKGSGQNKGSAALILPSLSIYAGNYNNALLTLKSLLLSASGQSGISAGAILNLPKLSLVSSGKVNNLGQLDGNLGLLKLSANGTGGFVGTVNASFKALTINASGKISSNGLSALVLPSLEITATGGNNSIGTASISLPSLLLSSINSVALNGLYSALSLNTNNNALTTYENYLFNSMTMFNGVPLGANDSGIFLLQGATDNATPITFNVTLGNTDFGTELQKRIEMLYIGYRSDGDITVTIICDDSDSFEYTLESTGNSGIYNNRLKTGKGLKARYYQLDLVGQGSSFVLDNLTVEPVSLSRKIA